MPRICSINFRVLIFAAVFGLLAGSGLAQKDAAETQIHAASVGHGITLHYVAEGTGLPVIFVHGSLSDGGYWADQIAPFAKHYHAIAYRSDDLAALIHTLHLGKVAVIGHSYGALTALFLAARHPQLVRALVLAEPPGVSLLADVHSDEAARGKAMFDDLQQRMVRPMQQAYQKGDREEGIRIFLAYVLNDPHAWDNMSQSSRDHTLQDAREWDVMMTNGTLFPAMTPQAVQRISAPVLLLMGAKSYPFLGVIGRELARLLPKNRTIIFPDAGHQM